MLRLLDIEFQKFKHHRPSIILTILYFGLLASITAFGLFKITLGGKEISFANQGFLNFPIIWHYGTYFASFFKVFLLIVIVSMMANEYSYKTLKQNLIDGLSKKEFLLSKFYMIVFICFLSTLFVGLNIGILGATHSANMELSSIIKEIDFLLAFFVKLVGFFSFGLFLGLLVKRSAFAIGAFFSWFLFESIFTSMMKNYWNNDALHELLYNYLPLNAISNLIKEPVSRSSIVKQGAETIGLTLEQKIHTTPLEYLIVIGWIAIFLGLSYWLLKRRDL